MRRQCQTSQIVLSPVTIWVPTVCHALGQALRMQRGVKCTPPCQWRTQSRDPDALGVSREPGVPPPTLSWQGAAPRWRVLGEEVCLIAGCGLEVFINPEL